MLLQVNELRKYYPIHEGLFSRTVGHVKAVDRVTFLIRAGETLGLVGESGCGKSVMALACRPNLLIADEPTTALDVTTQAQILTLMRELQHELGMAIVFITHDLGVIAQMTETVMVMYLGRVVEMAQIDPLFYAPQHPYTQALLRSIPRLGERTRSRTSTRLNAIQGTVPDPYAMPRGCAFHTRGAFNDHARCELEEPALREIRPGHFSRCHYAGELALPGVGLIDPIT